MVDEDSCDSKHNTTMSNKELGEHREGGKDVNFSVVGKFRFVRLVQTHMERKLCGRETDDTIHVSRSKKNRMRNY